MNIKVSTWGNTYLTDFVEQISPKWPTINIFEDLNVETCNPGGFTVASFTLHRPITQYWSDLQPRNQVVISEGIETVFEGYMDKCIRSINPDQITVDCLGWSSALNELGTTTDVTVTGAANNQASDWITGTLLAGGSLVVTERGISAGTVETGDYAMTAGTRFEFGPWTSYFDCLEQFNEANNYDWGVWEDKKFYWMAKTPTVVDWLVYTGDCADLTITPDPARLCNTVIVSYTQDSVHQQSTTRTNAASIALYGTIEKTLAVSGRCITADAQNIGDKYLTDCATLRVGAEFTTTRVFDNQMSEAPLHKVRAGDVVKLVDWLPTEETLTGVNDITTFQVKSTSYDHTGQTLQITPTEFVSQVEITLARIAARNY